MRRIAKQSDSAIGDALRLRFKFGAAELLVQMLYVCEAIFIQSQARLGLQNPAHRLVYSLLGKPPGAHRSF